MCLVRASSEQRYQTHWKVAYFGPAAEVTISHQIVFILDNSFILRPWLSILRSFLEYCFRGAMVLEVSSWFLYSALTQKLVESISWRQFSVTRLVRVLHMLLRIFKLRQWLAVSLFKENVPCTSLNFHPYQRETGSGSKTLNRRTCSCKLLVFSYSCVLVSLASVENNRRYFSLTVEIK